MAVGRSIGTHDGPFHADEVSACALLAAVDLIDPDKIVRTRDPEALEECEFVCDVGGLYDPNKKRFDHHQAEYVGPLSSAGMVLRYLRDQGILTEEEFGVLRGNMFDGIDAHDNGKDIKEKGVCTFSHVIANMVPVSYDAGPEEMDAAFMAAVTFTLGHVERIIARVRYVASCREEVAQAMTSTGPALIFERKLPWIDNFFALGGVDHPAQFVVMPAGDHWKLRGIPPDLDNRMAVRVPMPKAWAGLQDDDLVQACGIEGAIFCHKGRFISVWETKQAALQALETALDAHNI